MKTIWKYIDKSVPMPAEMVSEILYWYNYGKVLFFSTNTGSMVVMNDNGGLSVGSDIMTPSNALELNGGEESATNKLEYAFRTLDTLYDIDYYCCIPSPVDKHANQRVKEMTTLSTTTEKQQYGKQWYRKNSDKYKSRYKEKLENMSEEELAKEKEERHKRYMLKRYGTLDAGRDKKGE